MQHDASDFICILKPLSFLYFCLFVTISPSFFNRLLLSLLNTPVAPFASFPFLLLVALLHYRPGSRSTPSPRRGSDPQPVCVSVCASVRGQISLSSELQPGSLPPDADESSSDMLVIVDDPVSSAPQSRATNSPASVTGSVSDNMNGEESKYCMLAV